MVSDRKHNTNSKYNRSYKPNQSNSKLSIGSENKTYAKSSSKRFQEVMTVEDFYRVIDDILEQARSLYLGSIAGEMLDLVPSREAGSRVLTVLELRHEIGPRPERTPGMSKEEYSQLEDDYKTTKEHYLKSFYRKMDKYKEELTKAIGWTISDYLSDGLKIKIKNFDGYREYVHNATSMADYFSWLLNSLRSLYRWNDDIEENQIYKLLTHGLKIKTCYNKVNQYLNRVRVLFERYKTIKMNQCLNGFEESIIQEIDNQDENPVTREARLEALRINNEKVRQFILDKMAIEVDSNSFIINAVYKEMKENGLNPTYEVMLTHRDLSNFVTSDTNYYKSMDEMLRHFDEFIQMIALEGPVIKNAYHLEEGESKRLRLQIAALEEKINQQEGESNSKVPETAKCNFCQEHQPNNKRARYHLWEKCFYNEKHPNFNQESKDKVMNKKLDQPPVKQLKKGKKGRHH